MDCGGEIRPNISDYYREVKHGLDTGNIARAGCTLIEKCGDIICSDCIFEHTDREHPKEEEEREILVWIKEVIEET